MSPQTLGDIFERQVEASPNDIALIYEDKRISYAELNARANRVAHDLVANHHVGPDVLVGLRVRRSDWMIVGVLAILKAGGAYVPIDPAYPDPRQAFMLADAGLQVLLADELSTPSSWDGELRVCDVTSIGHGQPATNPVRRTAATDLAYVIYTSGSTGEPKGVMIEHRSIVNTLSWRRRFYRFGPNDVTLQIPSMSFDSSVEDIFGMLLCGGALVIMKDDQRYSLSAMAQLLRRHEVTHILVVPSLYRTMLAEIGDALCGLRVVTVAGEAVTGALVEQHHQRLPEVMLVNEYGPTEGSVCSTACVLTAEDRAVTIGSPIDNVEVHILNDALEPAAQGEAGQICLAGQGLMRGYRRRPDLTADKLIPRGPRGERLYLTGDRGRIDAAGRIEFLGRIDRQVKVRGFRVEPGEVERALHDHPGVAQAFVSLRPTTLGEVLVAHVEPRGALDVAELQRSLSARLPAHMVPSRFILVEELPRLPNGKIDISSLPMPVEAGAAGSGAGEPQRQLMRLLEPLLGLRNIGVRDNIFALGAHSLLVAQLIARIERSLGRVLTPLQVFEHPTIEALCEIIARQAPCAAGPAPVAERPRPSAIPLTYQQEQVWFQHKLVPDNLAYNAQFTLRLEGHLDHAALEASLHQIIARHEILRTTFPEVDGRPVQVVHPPWPARVEVIDLTAWPGEAREREAERQIQLASRRSFDFSRLPLIRWCLYRLDERTHILLTTEFHFVHDGWSAALFLRELKALYEAHVEGRAPSLAPVPLQLADYAVWQRSPAFEPEIERALEHWREALRGHDFVLDLYPARPRPKTPTFAGGLIRRDLPAHLYRELRAFSRAQGGTLFTTLLAAFANLLCRYSGQRDLLIGTAVANRPHKDVEQMLGMVVNILPLRLEVRPTSTFEELVAHARRALFSALEHQQAPIQRIVERQKPRRVPGMNPLFQVQLSFHDSPVPDLDFAGLRGDLTIRHNGTTKVDLDVICVPRAEQRIGREKSDDDDRLTILWQYSRELFDEETMTALLDSFIAMLSDAVSRPTAGVAHLDVLSVAERARVLKTFNDTRTDDDAGGSLQARFERAARAHAGRVAVLGESDRSTYAALNARANQLAHHLIEQGIGRGDVVGLLGRRSPRSILSIMGIVKAGAAFAALDPQYPERRLRFIVQDTRARLIVVAGAAPEATPNLGDLAPLCDLDASAGALDRSPTTDPGVRNEPGDPLYVIYTSGSTGTPKGVVGEHGGLLNLIRWYAETLALTERDTLLALSSLNFDVSVMDIFTTLLHGATLLFSEGLVGDDDAVAGAIAQRGCTIVSATPSAVHGVFEPGRMGKLAGLRAFVFAGEPIHKERLRGWVESGHCHARIINAYGPTETTVLASAHVVTEHDWRSQDPIPIGLPIANMRMHVLDEHLQLLPCGVPGEIYIGGVGVTKGYLNQPDLTERAFIPDPFEPGQRLYRSGDLGRRLADGAVVCLGRRDNQVKVRGIRVELGEIEACLESHPEITRAVAAIQADGPDTLLVAYVVTGGSVNTAELRKHLSQSLPQHMIPSRFALVPHIPMTPSGKVDLGRLQTTVDAVALGTGVSHVPPRTETERSIAAIWREILQVDRVGAMDNFFALGGHSLMATRVLSLVRARLGVEIPLNAMFKSENLAALAEHVDMLSWANQGAPAHDEGCEV
ncbi:amino acid adenylation domain-containing protein [Sorangium sp. So ce429]